MARGAMDLPTLGALAVAVAVLALTLASNPGPPHLLLLLDASASMASQNRFEKMNVAVKGWIENFVPEGIKLSLWKFASDAEEIKSVIIDKSPVLRQDLINSLLQIETRSSCISCAIETVLKQVTNNATILLITDGEDKFLEQDLKDLSNKIETSQSKIIAVLMGNSLNNIHLLEELTGGSINHVADTNSVLGLLDTLQAALLTVKNFTVPINIHEEEFSSSENNFNSTFIIDSTIAQNTCINLYYWPFDMPLTVEFLTPKGDSQKIPSKQLKSGNLKYCRLPEMVGKWEVKMFSSTFNKFLAFQITATKNESENKSDITSNCWIEMGENYLSLCGSVHPGKYFINETKISVDIIAEDGKVTKQELLHIFGENNEKGLKENLFVRKHLNITSGYYSARCRAEGKVWEVTDEDLEQQQFTRVSWAGTFKMDESHGRSSLPSEINDLFASAESEPGKCTITMEFSAPIKAVKYKLILSSSLYDVLSDEGLILATVPGMEGTKERINFRVPSWLLSPPAPLYVAMSAVGENEMEGEVSNIVLVMCHKEHTVTSPPSLSHVPEITMYSTHKDISTMSFTTQKSILNTTASQGNITHNSTLPLNHPNSSSPSSPDYEKEISLATEVNNFTTFGGFFPNSSQVIPSNNSVVIEKNNHDNEKQPFNIIGAIGILIAVLLTAVAAILTYHTLYNRRRCKSYEVASRQSNSQDPFNENDEL